jgi:hypothetical protein
MTPGDPQSAAEYDDRTTSAVKTVLVEIGQVLGSFKGKFAIIGGAVPWLLLGNEEMPHVGTVCSIPALLAMKGHAIEGRYKQKDAYDIYYCTRNYPGGPEALAEACRPLLDHASGAAGYGFIAAKFDNVEGFGPTCVRRFVQDTNILGDRTPEQWQQDAFGQVEAWLRALGLRG